MYLYLRATLLCLNLHKLTGEKLSNYGYDDDSVATVTLRSFRSECSEIMSIAIRSRTVIMQFEEICWQRCWFTCW